MLTDITMLTEMTQDHSIMLPLVITCSVAYAVRKGIMNESIYTMKLRARGHSVPEGLHASVLTSRRIPDLMATDFAVVPQGGKVPTGSTLVVHDLWCDETPGPGIGYGRRRVGRPPPGATCWCRSRRCLWQP